MIVWQVCVLDFVAFRVLVVFYPPMFFNDFAVEETFLSPASSTGNICFLLVRS
jgi:hypothetical protein